MRVREIFRRQSLAHIAFEIGIFFKGLDGVLEIVGGLLLFFVKPETISRVRAANNFSASSQVFAGIYLLSHGVIKIVLVESLLRRRLLAYPTAIVVFALFIMYQMYRYYLDSSIAMIALSILDVIVIVLTWLEYRRLKRARHRV